MERLAATVTFDIDDIYAAFEELDARYLAGEAARSRAHMVGSSPAAAARSSDTNSLR